MFVTSFNDFVGFLEIMYGGVLRKIVEIRTKESEILFSYISPFDKLINNFDVFFMEF